MTRVEILRLLLLLEVPSALTFTHKSWCPPPWLLVRPLSPVNTVLMKHIEQNAWHIDGKKLIFIVIIIIIISFVVHSPVKP